MFSKKLVKSNGSIVFVVGVRRVDLMMLKSWTRLK
jgi:hypothetical protein